jgi:hypothetical protein
MMRPYEVVASGNAPASRSNNVAFCSRLRN